MAAEEDDLVTHLLLENRKLRQLYLAEQQRALAERKRRIAAEAHLAALLSMKVMEMRKQNSYVIFLVLIMMLMLLLLLLLLLACCYCCFCCYC